MINFKMKREGKVKSLVVISVLIGVLFMSFASAGVIDWIKATITGKASFQQTNVSVTLVGVDPVSITVHNATLVDTDVDPTESGQVNITFNVTVTDVNGASDINTSSVFASFLKPNEETRANTTGCVENSGEDTANSKNFSCTIAMWYFDAPGGWTINVSARDLGNGSVNSTDYYNFSYDQLQAIEIYPESVFWNSVSVGSTNQTASNSTMINNTGNYNATGNIEINATNLYSGSNFLDVGNISIGIDVGSECNGTFMVNAENTAVSGIVLERGNLSTGNANETIYYCIAQVPSNLPSGTYDTNSSGAWTIKLA